MRRGCRIRKALDLAPVGRPVAGKHFEPGVGDRFKFAYEPDVGDIAGDHNRIDAAVAKIGERPFKRLRIVAFRKRPSIRGKFHVHLAHHAEFKPRASAARRRSHHPAPGSESRAREHSGNKITPFYHIHTSLRLTTFLPTFLKKLFTW